VFISYSHQNVDLALEIEQVLKASGLTPMYDKNFAVGHSFDQQIKTFIAHAHVFLPIITQASSERGWVHQEIGYAMALNVPILPVTIGVLPGEMLQNLHAIQLSENPDERPTQIEQGLAQEVFENLVNRYQGQDYASYESAEFTDDRALMMARFANEILDLREYGLVRQKGALSSFHIPDSVLNHPVWKERYGRVNMSRFHFRCQREERRALERHARVAGCRLMIDPSISYRRFGPDARIVRLKKLVKFLESMKNDKAEVAINTRMGIEESVTIVGDWFAAESVSSTLGQGYRQTIFTRHAPSMQYRIDLFDQEFQERLEDLGWEAQSSKEHATKELKGLIHELETKQNEKAQKPAQRP
jgi:hypothetical protein